MWPSQQAPLLQLHAGSDESPHCLQLKPPVPSQLASGVHDLSWASNSVPLPHFCGAVAERPRVGASAVGLHVNLTVCESTTVACELHAGSSCLAYHAGGATALPSTST